MDKSQTDFDIILEAEWEIWYQDNFDLECPRQMEIEGRGLVKGLIELWAHHLYETIQPNVFVGFSRFNLWWKQKECSIEIIGEMLGQVKIRQWVYGNRQSNYLGCMHIADIDLLRVIAEMHCRLVLNDETSEVIIAKALSLDTNKDFIKQIQKL
jgi:hypothetical protein